MAQRVESSLRLLELSSFGLFLGLLSGVGIMVINSTIVNGAKSGGVRSGKAFNQTEVFIGIIGCSPFIQNGLFYLTHL